ncbi:MAG: helix-turn-helix domain-containing protein [Mycobacterium sp.]
MVIIITWVPGSPENLDRPSPTRCLVCLSGESATTIAATLDVSRATVYRVLTEQADHTD